MYSGCSEGYLSVSSNLSDQLMLWKLISAASNPPSSVQFSNFSAARFYLPRFWLVWTDASFSSIMIVYHHSLCLSSSWDLIPSLLSSSFLLPLFHRMPFIGSVASTLPPTPRAFSLHILTFILHWPPTPYFTHPCTRDRPCMRGNPYKPILPYPHLWPITLPYLQRHTFYNWSS